MPEIFDLEPQLAIPEGDSYTRSYPSLLGYFQDRHQYAVDELVCGAHMVYGWMPTILDVCPSFRDCDLQRCAHALSTVRNNAEVADREIVMLVRFMNNSLVGTSKLLHFASPATYAIWDANVYKYVFRETAHHYRLNSLKKYRQYLALLQELSQHTRFRSFYDSIQKKIGYPVSQLRALEFGMFLGSKKQQASQAL